MQIIPLVVITAFLVLGVLGTVGKLLFDDWRVRHAMRAAILLHPVPEKPVNPSGNWP